MLIQPKQLSLPFDPPQPKEIEDGLKETKDVRGPYADDLLETATPGTDARPGKRVLQG